MYRRFIVVGILAGLATVGSADVRACGDKFLRVGRSARYRSYAAIHPASILIYASANSKPAGIKELEDLLRRAGHTALSVKHGSPLAEPLASARYDLVIAAYADADTVKKQLESIPSRPDLLPLLNKPTKALAAEAEKAYPFLLKPHAMTKFEALAEIDHLMSRRVKVTTLAAVK